MAKVLVDIYKTRDLYSGLGQFSRQFAVALQKQGLPGFDVNFLVPPGESTPVETEYFHRVQASFQKRYLPGLNSHFDLWHSLHQFPSHLPKKGTKWLLTIHDLNFMLEKDGRKARKYLHRLQEYVDRAHALTTISHFTRTEIERHIDVKDTPVHVIYNGVDPGVAGSAHMPMPDPGKFFFSIGIFSEKKNFKVLLPMMTHFPNHKLVIAGNSDTAYGREIRAFAIELGVADRVILPGKISEAQKQWYYAHCDAFLFPSLAEGFGMPVIEAMHAGAPVFLSNRTSLPEIGGDAAFYFHDFSAQTMGHLVAQKLEEIGHSRSEFSAAMQQYAARYSWESCIRKYAELYQELAG